MGLENSWFSVLDSFTNWTETSKWWMIQTTRIYWALLTHGLGFVEKTEEKGNDPSMESQCWLIRLHHVTFPSVFCSSYYYNCFQQRKLRFWNSKEFTQGTHLGRGRTMVPIHIYITQEPLFFLWQHLPSRNQKITWKLQNRWQEYHLGNNFLTVVLRQYWCLVKYTSSKCRMWPILTYIYPHETIITIEKWKSPNHHPQIGLIIIWNSFLLSLPPSPSNHWSTLPHHILALIFQNFT